jgi:hypothetical protein
MSNYTIDANAARAADQINSRISETGKYVGVLTRAEEVKSKKGTIGVEFSFKADDGQTADYLTTWTRNTDGKVLYGFKQLMAVMACCKVRNITATPGQVEKYDRDAGAVAKMPATIYPELTGKRIGLLLQVEEYARNDGSIGEKMAIAGAFEADTEFTPSEIMDKATKPEKLARMVSALKDRRLSSSTSAAPAGNYSAPAQSGGFAPDMEDCPF